MALKDKEARKRYNAERYKKKQQAASKRCLFGSKVEVVAVPFAPCVVVTDLQKRMFWRRFGLVMTEMLNNYAEFDKWKYWKNKRYEVMLSGLTNV
jgi:predicted enzyme involved in methoxymalonyl-ACP biosynthesis